MAINHAAGDTKNGQQLAAPLPHHPHAGWCGRRFGKLRSCESRKAQSIKVVDREYTVQPGFAVFLFTRETLELVVCSIRFRQYGSLTCPLF